MKERRKKERKKYEKEMKKKKKKKKQEKNPLYRDSNLHQPTLLVLRHAGNKSCKNEESQYTAQVVE